MNLSFFAYIDESTDENFPASTIIKTEDAYHRGRGFDVTTDGGGYSAIGLDAISYTDEEDLKQQVNVILTEMGI